MSYAVPPPQKQRPSSVNVASMLLWAYLAIQLIGLILTFLPNAELDRAVDDFKRENPDFDESIFTAITAVTLAISAVFAIGLGVLAIFVRRGSQPARIVTWVIGGLLALCQVCLLGSSALPTTTTTSGGDEAALYEEYARILTEHTPAWLVAATIVLNIAAVLSLIGAIILLALPSSNDYFRKEAEVWVPPTEYPGGGYSPPGSQNPPAPPPSNQ